jgi:serine/threonine-protein kinase
MQGGLIAKRRSGWHGAVDDEESRAYLQERLIVMAKLMFWSFATLLAFMLVTYKVYKHLLDRPYEPRLNHYVYAMSAGGMATLAFLWRGLLMRRPLPMSQLQRIDEFFLIGTGTIFCVSAVIAYDLRASAYICLTYICLNVVLRATIVPSTGRRTAIVGTLACMPMTVGTGVLVYINHQDVPGPVYVGGGLLISLMAIFIATIVSNTLYTYRRQITEAMQLGQYTLDRKIGEGGNGAVYRARHALLRRPTAIKLMLPNLVDGDTLDRFEREVQHMSQLTHANTVAVFDYGRSPDGVFYYAMEYLDGIDLENLVRRYGAQPAERVVPILIQVCGALYEAHRRGLIHRDIKPANIILSERGDVPDVAKVVDFGLVKEIAANEGRSHTRGIMGTPTYIAPETVTDPDTIGAAADLYSLGAVGYFMLTGKRVFDGKTSVDICVQHVTASPVPPTKVAPEGVVIPQLLEDILLRCLAKPPAARPESAAELARMLRAVPLGDAWPEARATTWWEEFRKTEAATPTAAEATRTVTIDIGLRTPVSQRQDPS